MADKSISPTLSSDAAIREALGIINDPQSSQEDIINSKKVLSSAGKARVKGMKKSMTRTGDYLAPEAGLKHGGKVKEGYHKMPDGKIMKDSAHKNKMAHGGKVGRGCGSAMKGGGSVMNAGK